MTNSNNKKQTDDEHLRIWLEKDREEVKKYFKTRRSQKKDSFKNANSESSCNN